MAEQEENKPQWLVELENRKRKPRLGHETGAGAPCLTCESACPGLDLHFWRKLCKNCKCRGDEHDFDDEDFPQFELIFGPSIKKNKRARSVLLQIDNKKIQSQNTFEWIPPNATKELAAEYMNALPSEKLPILGSPGAALRKQQLKKQLPLHDIDHKACDKLSEEEMKEFNKYLDNLKNCAGQGKVFKLTTIKPFDQSLMTPANASDVQHFSPQHSQQKSLFDNSKLNLRTPSSFISKSLENQAKSYLPGETVPLAYTEDVLRPQQELASQEKNPHHPARYHHVLKNIPNSTNMAQQDTVQGVYSKGSGIYNSRHQPLLDKTVSSKTMNSNNSNFPENVETMPCNINTTKLLPQKLQGRVENIGKYFEKNLEFSQGLPQTSRSQSEPFYNSSNETTSHDKISLEGNLLPSELKYSKNPSLMANSENVQAVSSSLSNLIGTHNSNLNQNYDTSSDRSTPYELKPIHNSSSIISSEPTDNTLGHQSINSLPHNSKIDKIKWPNVQNLEFSSNLPPHLMSNQNSSEALLNNLDTEKAKDTLNRELHSLNSPESFHMNIEKLRKLNAPHSKEDGNLKNQSLNSDNTYQLPSQMPYAKCLQADLNTSLPVKSNIIHSEALNNPVFADDSFEASVAYQNSDNIGQLQEEMEGMTMNVTKEHKCHKCEEDINCGDVVVSAEKIENAVWHPGCFVCSACNELLVDLVYFTHKGKLYCGRDLAELLKIPRCFACDELIFVREYTVAEGHNYHVKHFCCWDCDIPLADQQYVTENDRPLCLPCYKNNYAKTCETCHEVIAADQQGVTIKNLDFHATDKCFCCFECNKSLLGGQIAVKENKLLCSKECIIIFLQKKI